MQKTITRLTGAVALGSMLLAATTLLATAITVGADGPGFCC